MPAASEAPEASFVLASSDGWTRIEFTDAVRDHRGFVRQMNVSLIEREPEGRGDSELTARTRVDVESYIGDARELASLLREMAQEWKGWTGKKTWAPPASQIHLAFRHDGTSHVIVEVDLEPERESHPGFLRGWRTKSEFSFELGTLEKAARDLGAFLGVAGR